MDLIHFSVLALVGFVAGLVGALLGIGGGVFVVPALVLGFHTPTIVAVGASNVAVVATSTAGASSYLRSRAANVRVGLVLLISTAAAAMLSALVASLLPSAVLSGLFVVILVYVSLTILRPQRRVLLDPPASESARLEIDNHAGSERSLEGIYYDPATGTRERYSPTRVPEAMGVSLIAGIVAGLLGVGGGIIQVPVMNLLMKMPMKTATATSNFMIGVTATGAAFVRYAHGDIDPLLAAPAALFVFLGARAGAWLAPRIPAARLRLIFGWVSLIIAVLMALQALGIYNTGGR